MWPNVFTRVLKEGGGRGKREDGVRMAERVEPCTLKREAGPQAEEHRGPLEAEKGKETGSSLGASRKNQPYQYLDFKSREL